MLEVLDAAAARRWVRHALEALGRERDTLDTLNVFPVPDGDTGTNLYLTIEAAARAVDEWADHETSAGDRDDLGATLRVLAHGAFLGARGNSGVIVGQVLRGMADAVPDGADLPGVDGRVLGAALVRASRAAYAAVAAPVEGTVLTVVRDAADAVATARDVDLVTVARTALDAATASLQRTPDLLPVLREHGVVDAGGAGLVLLLSALVEVVTETTPTDATRIRLAVPARPVRPVVAPSGVAAGPSFEVMYLLDAPDEAIEPLRTALGGLGDSLLVVGSEGVWSVHVHVDDVGAAIEAGLQSGAPYRIRVSALLPSDAVAPARAAAGAPGCAEGAVVRAREAVTVVSTPALGRLLASVGATAVSPTGADLADDSQAAGLGGPSPDDVLAAIRARAGQEVIIVAGDAAVRPSAEAAAAAARADGVRVAVIPVSSVVQVLAALAVHDSGRSFDDDVVAMTSAAGATRYAEVRVARARSMTMVGVCEPGDVLGLVDGDVVVVGASRPAVASAVLDRMLGGGGELVTLIHGGGDARSAAAAVHDDLHGRRPDLECVVYDADTGEPTVDLLLIGVE